MSRRGRALWAWLAEAMELSPTHSHRATPCHKANLSRAPGGAARCLPSAGLMQQNVQRAAPTPQKKNQNDYFFIP